MEALRDQGNDVAWVRKDTPGISDIEVLQRAQIEGRTIVTFDKDFGELAFRLGLPADNGIILFRVHAQTPAHVARIAVAALNTLSDWGGHFSVVEEGRIRMTPFPNKN